MTAYASALLLTLVVEVPVVALCHKRHRWLMALVAAATTTATHHAMHHALRAWFSLTGYPILTAEVAVTAAEALVYLVAFAAIDRALRRGDAPPAGERPMASHPVATALGVSLAANASSYGAGLLLL